MGEKRVSIFVLFLLTMLLPGFSWSAPFDDFKLPAARRLDLFTSVNLYLTDANFDKAGNTHTKFPSGYSYNLVNADFGARAGLNPRWHIYGAFNFASARSENLSTGISQSKTNTGFSEMSLGSDFVLIDGPFSLIPDVTVIFPLTETSRSGTDVAIGEGVSRFLGRMVARFEGKVFRFGGYAGIEYRDGGRAMVLPYGVLAEWKLGRWFLGADLRGYQPVSNDKDLPQEAFLDLTYFCPANGCAKRFAALNPSLLKTDLWARMEMSPRWAFFANFAMDLTGASTTRGYGVEGGLIYRWPFPRSRSSETPTFQETMDGIDQTPFAPTGSRSMTPPVDPPQRMPPRRPPPMPNLKEELNKTEMQIDLKKDKRGQ